MMSRNKIGCNGELDKFDNGIGKCRNGCYRYCCVVGPTGPQGLQGEVGPTGPVGSSGGVFSWDK